MKDGRYIYIDDGRCPSLRMVVSCNKKDGIIMKSRVALSVLTIMIVFICLLGGRKLLG